jgi:endonuclease/exonuclease/phosphatase family metal-dependent hydrolase
VVSFNVHHGDDLPALLRSLRTHAELCAADVFLLQEIESFPAEGKSRTRRLAEALGLNYVYAPARLKEAGDGTHGLAVLSRFPLTSIEVIPLKQYNLGVNTRRRIALGVTVEVGARKLRVYNVHLDTRINARQRIEQLQPVLEAAGAAPADAVVVGGDFNTNPLYWLLPVLPLFRSNQAKAVDDHMKKSGFTTPFSETGGTMKKWGGRYRVDAIYSRGVGLRGSGVEEGVTVSDHFPIWVDVAWPEKPEQKAGSSSAPRAGNRFGMTSFGTWVGVAQALLPVLNSAHKHGRTARSGCATYTERLRHVSR